MTTVHLLHSEGGNIKGIINRLDYIADLGANSILLSPFFKSNAYHGYHCTTDMNEIEPQFGNGEDILSFVKHTKGHKIDLWGRFRSKSLPYNKSYICRT